MVGFVVIGRNEGERLKRCLASLGAGISRCIYVDSGSTDGSRSVAIGLGAGVVELDLSEPFTAARARNAGFAELRARLPDLDVVQFIDGDCSLAGGWIEAAASYLGAHQDVAVVCGRRREMFPEKSVFNRLCDVEWDTPVGQATACGGDAMFRAGALEGVGGFREDLIAGEEPELCWRLRCAGWAIWRLPFEMTTHDAAMTRLSQWWLRAMRAGYAFANGASLHGRSAERYCVREVLRAFSWGLALPLLIIIGCLLFGAVALWALLLYPLQAARIACSRADLGAIRWSYGFFVTLAKFPETLGVLRFARNRALGRRSRLIEYK